MPAAAPPAAAVAAAAVGVVDACLADLKSQLEKWKTAAQQLKTTLTVVQRTSVLQVAGLIVPWRGVMCGVVGRRRVEGNMGLRRPPWMGSIAPPPQAALGAVLAS